MRNIIAFITVLTALILTSCNNDSSRGPQVVAHRGYWKCEGGAQNSISSLSNAAQIKVWGSEFDVWITSDDTLVVNHDPTFHKILIKDTTFAAIKNLKLDNGELISTLDDYLAKAVEFPDLQLVLEIKTYKDKSLPEYEERAVPACVDAVRKYGLEKRTTFIAFSITACEMLTTLIPECPVQYLNGDLTPEEVHSRGIGGIDYRYTVFQKHPEWVSEAHDLGMKVNCWTVNAPSDIQEMIDLGVDQITTNEPTLLQKIISGKK